MSETPEDDKKPKKKKLLGFLTGTTIFYPVYMSLSTYVNTPALMSAGVPGMIGAGVIGFAGFAATLAAGLGGGAVGLMLGFGLASCLPENKSKRYGLATLVTPGLIGVLGGVFAANAAVTDPLEEEILRKLPQPEIETQEPQKKSNSVFDLSALSDTANQTFARDQVLMQSPTRALVLPAGYQPRAAM